MLCLYLFYVSKIWLWWQRGNKFTVPVEVWELPQFRNPWFNTLSPFTAPNKLPYLLYNCVCLTAEHIALEQPVSQLSSTVILVRLNQWRWMWSTHGWGGLLTSWSPPTPPPNIEIKKTHFCIHDAIKHFMWFTLQPNPTNETDRSIIH